MTAGSHEPPPSIAGYEFVKFLAAGGFSTVYLYREVSEHVDRKVAVKALKLVGTTDLMRQQFTTEARAMTRLGDHDNIVQVFRVGVADDGRPYLIMQYYPGADLLTLVGTRRFTVAEVLRIGVEIACAVHTAHQADILHKDIKPANVLAARYKDHLRCALTDFGIAGRIAATTEELMLSVPWSPGEIVTGEAGASVRSDIYSLGATLWHLLVGHAPFQLAGTDTAEELERRIDTAPRPRTGRSDVPASLESLLAKAMARDPGSRPASAEELAELLRRVERELDLPMTPMALLAGDDEGGTPLPRLVSHTTPRARPALPPVEPTALRPQRTTVVPETVVSTTFRQPSGYRPATQLVTGPERAAAEHTRLRVTDPAPESTPQGRPPRRATVPIVLACGAAVAAAAVVGVILMSGGGPAESIPPASTQNTASAQDPGVPGQNLPPGEPKVVATRLGSATLRFTWTYSAALANDTFSWQTTEGGQHGTAKAPTVDLPVAAGQRLCLQVKVFRADGSYGSTEWSPAGCGGGDPAPGP